MNYFLSWCRPLLVAFLFHAVTSLLPPSFYWNDFSTCNYTVAAERVCAHVFVSVYDCSRTAGNEVASERYQQLQCNKRLNEGVRSIKRNEGGCRDVKSWKKRCSSVGVTLLRSCRVVILDCYTYSELASDQQTSNFPGLVLCSVSGAKTRAGVKTLRNRWRNGYASVT